MATLVKPSSGSKYGEGCPTVLHALGELTQQAEDAIRRKDAERLGQILSQAHLHLKRNWCQQP